MTLVTPNSDLLRELVWTNAGDLDKNTSWVGTTPDAFSFGALYFDGR